MWGRTIVILAAFLVSAAAGGAAKAAQPGTVHEWLVAGYFEDPDPNKLLNAPPVGDPATLAPSLGQPAGKRKWLKLKTHTGVVEFRDNPIVTIINGSTVSAFVYVYSPKMQPVKLLMGIQTGNPLELIVGVSSEHIPTSDNAAIHFVQPDFAAILNRLSSFPTPDDGSMGLENGN